MGIILRQSIRNAIVSYIGVALGFVLIILLYPKALSPAEFGLTRIFLSLALMLSQIADLGLRHVILRYFPYFKNENRGHHGILFWVLILPIVGILIISAIYLGFEPQLIEFYRDESRLFEKYFLLFIPLLIFNLYFEVLIKYMQAQLDTVKASFLQHVFLRLLMLILVISVWFGWVNFNQFMILFVAVYALLPLLIIIYLASIRELYLKPDLGFIDLKKAREMLVYGGYTMFGGLTTIIVGRIDTIMLGAMIDLSSSGIYSIAFYVGSVILIPRQSINRIAIPYISRSFMERDFKTISDIYTQSARNQLLAGLLLYIGIWANMQNLMRIIPESYVYAAEVILVIGAARLFDMATGINGGIIKISKHFRFNVWANVILILLTFISNYLLIPIYGIMGAAMATSISILIYNVIKLIFVWFKMNMQPFDLKFLYIIGIGLLVLFISFQMPAMGSLIGDIIIRSGAMAILYLGIIKILHVSPEFDRLVKSGFDWLRNNLKI